MTSVIECKRKYTLVSCDKYANVYADHVKSKLSRLNCLQTEDTQVHLQVVDIISCMANIKIALIGFLINNNQDLKSNIQSICILLTCISILSDMVVFVHDNLPYSFRNSAKKRPSFILCVKDSVSRHVIHYFLHTKIRGGLFSAEF